MPRERVSARACIGWPQVWHTYSPPIAVSGIVVNLIKFAVGRARPRVYLEDGFFGFNPPGVDYEFQSFPSGHASTCFALVLSIAYFAPRYRMPLLLIGGFLALTRVLVSAHYLSDVLAGGAVAILVTLLLHRYCVEDAGCSVGFEMARSPCGRRSGPRSVYWAFATQNSDNDFHGEKGHGPVSRNRIGRRPGTRERKGS